ncbi:MAG: hypothetical protein EOP85_21875, partial [Verrucomicrobiaceae bacterium]
MKLSLPTARWFFEVSRNVPLLGGPDLPWFGWLSVVLLCGWGLMTVIRSFTAGPPNPVTVRRIRRFREIRRGYVSLLILIFLGGIAALDQVVVGKRALAVHHEGKWTFPAFLPYDLKNRDFGITDGSADAPADYRRLKRVWHDSKESRVIMPLVPYDPTGDTLQPRSRGLFQNEGSYHEPGSRKPYYGLVAKYHDIAEARMHLRYTMRNGRLTGPADGWNNDGLQVYRAEYKDGQLLSETYSGEGDKEAFLSLPTSDLRAVKYHPAPPIPEEGNWLGTTSQGYDVVAYLYGGLQVNFKAALIYLPLTYLIGVVIGMLMGYFGGWFDLVMDRLIEVFSNMPFLFVVIIFSSMVPERYKG